MINEIEVNKNLPKKMEEREIFDYAKKFDLEKKEYFSYLILLQEHNINIEDLNEYSLHNIKPNFFDTIIFNANSHDIELYKFIIGEDEKQGIDEIINHTIENLDSLFKGYRSSKKFVTELTGFDTHIRKGYGIQVLIYYFDDLIEEHINLSEYKKKVTDIVISYFNEKQVYENLILKDILNDDFVDDKALKMNKLDYLKSQEEKIKLNYANIKILVKSEIKRRYENFRENISYREEEKKKAQIMKEQDFFLSITDNQYYTFEDENDKNISYCVTNILGKDLVELYQELGYALFEENVRYFLSGNSAVSKSIRNTLMSKVEKQYFWYLNNGIIILVDDFKIKENKLSVRNPKIINGCQTTISLSNNSKYVDKNIKIMTKIIKINYDKIKKDSEKEKYKKFINDIVRSSNTQMAIKSYDLVTMDSIHDRIRIECEKMDPPYLYLYKRGQWDTISDRTRYRKAGRSYRILPMIEATQAYYSLTGYPFESKAKRYSLFEKGENGFYDEIFDKTTISALKLLFAFKIYGIINLRRKEFNKDIRKLRNSITHKMETFGMTLNEIVETELSFEEQKLLEKQFTAHSLYHIIALVGYVFKIKYGDDFLDKERFLENYMLDKSFESKIERLNENIEKRLTSIVTEENNKDPIFSYSKYFKDAKTFEQLKKEFEKDINLYKAFGKDPYTSLI